MLIQRIAAVVLLVTVILATSDSYGENYAVFIGVNHYKNSTEGDYKLDSLACCAADMVALKRALIRSQFVTEANTRLLTSDTAIAPTRANILATLDEILKKIRPDDLLLFAFAGHGLSLSEDGKSGDVICCSDAMIVRSGHCEGILYRSELEKLLSHDPEHPDDGRRVPHNKIFIFDACRSHPSVENRPGTRAIRGFGDKVGSQAQIMYPGIIRLASCAPGQISHENERDIKNGIFTHFLVKGLEGESDKKSNNGNGDGKITLNEMFDYAGTRTRTLFKDQTPTKTETELNISTSALVIGTCAPEVSKSVSQPVQTRPSTSRPSGRGGGGGQGTRVNKM